MSKKLGGSTPPATAGTVTTYGCFRLSSLPKPMGATVPLESVIELKPDHFQLIHAFDAVDVEEQAILLDFVSTRAGRAATKKQQVEKRRPLRLVADNAKPKHAASRPLKGVQ